jgi:hypothetical protein
MNSNSTVKLLPYICRLNAKALVKLTDTEDEAY